MKEAHDHHRVSQEGQALGQQMAKLFDLAERNLTDMAGPDDRCKTCAFRAGTVPNGCAQTQLDISKCVAEDIPFYCHQHVGHLCHGWVTTRTGIGGALDKLGMAEQTKDIALSPPDSQRHIFDAAEEKRERRAAKRRALAERQTAR